MIFTIIILVLALLVVLFLYGSKLNGAAVPKLSEKYPDLTTRLLGGNAKARIFHDRDNKLILGIKSLEAGSTLFEIKELSDGNVRIWYTVSESPMIPNFQERFEFTQATCLNDPDEVAEKIDFFIGRRIQKHLGNML
ncbi:hypothetical protein [Flaviaesturariibacter aridisoli]|uniref:Uncharacterized protein n=1 Tax=Flaviaesturariibacter aridisoli TaxID=2545761 RepID=A0A4R4E6G3_9BACT|nr:hypothetical protein [Flaviaesturariibacter aridisoli]TCZ73288.1 hypothetical protein E0486_06335 [Flaviaesturariibacter aridisoli]